MEQTFKLGSCIRCKATTNQELSRRILANGATQVGWWCLDCRWWVVREKGFWIYQVELKQLGVKIEDLRITEVLDQPRCVVCGSRGAELHHWAPKAIFGPEADVWPKDFLCVSCHLKWHEKMNTL